MDHNALHSALQATKILRPPKQLLATFGATTTHYVLLSEIPSEPNQCRLREGSVTTQKPRIMTPDVWRNRFEGFGDDSAEHQRGIDEIYGDTLRSLEYTFKNDLRSTSLEHTSLVEMADRAQRQMGEEDAPRMALLQGPDHVWSFCVMKFIVELSLRSFPSNVRELDDRGLFDPLRAAQVAQRKKVESLFAIAYADRAALSALGEFLKSNGLFAEYEDRFFALVRRP